MWGFHDRLLTLRKALHATLTNCSYKSALWRRWRWQQTLLNRQAGLLFSEDEWQNEWQNLLRLSSTKPRSRPGSKTDTRDCPTIKGMLDTVMENDQDHDVYESLEEIHVLALAHVLRRPIIVVADTMLKDATGEPFAPIPFGGIYLPLECPSKECHKSPLVLTYDAAHFSALVAMEKESYADKTPQLPAVIPLMDCEHQLLTIQFAVDPGEDFRWGIDEFDIDAVSRLRLSHRDRLNILHEYLDVTDIDTTTGCNGYVDEKKSSEGSFESDDSSPSENYISKTKASKQLQSVAKQFGSIGRTMSKKLKKNFGTLARIGRSNSFKESSCSFKLKESGIKIQDGEEKVQFHSRNRNSILSAALHTEKRHEYQEEMIRNYLHTAHERFEREIRQHTQQILHQKSYGVNDDAVQCINLGCSMFGTATTSYLCSNCYVKQKQHEQELQQIGVQSSCQESSSTLYGAGKSRFYAESDTNMFVSVAKMPAVRRLTPNQDQTLYLSKSTFYNDIQTSKPTLSSTSTFGVGNFIKQEVIINPTTHDAEVDETSQMNLKTSIAFRNSAKLNTESSKTTAALNASDENGDVKAISVAGPNSPRLCPTPKCQYFGNEENNFLCSQCYKDQDLTGTSNYIVQLRTTHI